MVDSPQHPVGRRPAEPRERDTVGASDDTDIASRPPGPHAPPAGERRIDVYRILRPLGEGGMGAVYLAEDELLGRKVAVKTMRPELADDDANRTRFFREAKAAAAIDSDHVVPIWRIGEAADGSPFIAMPYLLGESLESRLEYDPRPILPLVLRVAKEVALGLAAAHARGLTHRDVKPDNIWLEGDPSSPEPTERVRRCKILDFGLARSFESNDLRVTVSGAMLGSPKYMSPEQAQGERVDHRTDLFGLGVVLYRMTTGRFPFDGPTVMSVLTALAAVHPPAPRLVDPQIPPELSDLIQRLLSKDPDDRPRSAAEVVAEIEWIEEELARKQRPPASPTGSLPSAGLGTGWIVALTVAAVLIVGLGYRLIALEGARRYALLQQEEAVRQLAVAVEEKNAADIARKKADEAKIEADRMRAEAVKANADLQVALKAADDARKQAAEAVADRARLLAAAFDAAGTRFVLGHGDGSATVWKVDPANPAGWVREFELRGHGTAVTAAAFSADGTRLLTGSRDGTVKVWETAPGPGREDRPQPRELMSLSAGSPVTVVRFSSDGLEAEAVVESGRVVRWPAPPREPAKPQNSPILE